ncbi:MAG: DNA-processing protein DprA, partial [Thermomicrobiales bacterium]
EIQQGNLLVLTPFAPDAAFHVGNAMARNKLIYCLADAAVVVASESGRGGTYAGAAEALKAQWIPVGIVHSDDPASGATALVEQGGISLRRTPAFEVRRLLDRSSDGSSGESANRPGEPDAGSADDAFPGMIEEFVRYWRALQTEPTTDKELAGLLELHQSQVREWLNNLVKAKRVSRATKPIRYTLLD